MRHLELTENYLKEKFADGTCVLKKVDSKNNNADIGTKRLQSPAFDYLTYPGRPIPKRSQVDKDNKKINNSCLDS